VVVLQPALGFVDFPLVEVEPDLVEVLEAGRAVGLVEVYF
jgi:hypothetical protein